VVVPTPRLGIGIYNEALRYLFPIEPTARAVAASGDGIMLTSLSQLQALGWKKWLSRITFTRRTNYLKSIPYLRILAPKLECWGEGKTICKTKHKTFLTQPSKVNYNWYS
jgi:hypothetical protein